MCLFWTERKIFWRLWETEQYFFPIMGVNDDPKQPDYKLCSEQTHSCRCVTTWGWVNDDRIFIFGWIILLFFLIVSIRQQGLSFTLQSYLWANSLRHIRPPALMVFQGFCECARTWLWSMCHENEPNQLCFLRSDVVSRGSDAEHRDTWVPKEPALDACPAGITSRWVCFFISP